jgi:3,4-dihydroxy 2-butanone 4-phosphate synthase/GTP cyclohydrolase II
MGALAPPRAEEMIVLDGAVVLAAEHVRPADVNFLATHARGLICVALTPERCDALGLDPLPGSDFTVTVDARGAAGSAADRARTIRTLVDPRSGPRDLVQGGHVAPLRARMGRAAAALDLVRRSGWRPGAVVCEILTADGGLARGADVESFCARHGLRHQRSLVERVVATVLPTAYGEFRALGYRSRVDGSEHLALVKGDPARDAPVHVHVECLAGDALHSLLCDCRERLDAALANIEAEGRGVLVRLSRDGRNDLLAHDGDRRLAEEILADLGVSNAGVAAIV